MKKIYMNPQLDVIELDAADIVTTSVDTGIWMPAGSDQDWNLPGKYTFFY